MHQMNDFLASILDNAFDTHVSSTEIVVKGDDGLTLKYM